MADKTYSSVVQQHKFPFFGIVIMSNFFHTGQVLVSQIFWHMIMNVSIIVSPSCLISSTGKCLRWGIFVSSAFGLPLLLLLREWAYQRFHFEAVFRGCCHLCSVRSCRVLCSTRSISQVLPFFNKEVPFLSSMFDDRLDLFGEGFQDGISLSGVVSLHPSLYFSAPFIYPVVLCFSHSFSDVFI